MTRQDRSISIVVSSDEFDAIDAVAARYAVAPAELLRRIAQHTAQLSDALAFQGRTGKPQ